MAGQVIGVVLCLLPWLARLYVISKYQIRYEIARERRWAWKRGTPDWITRIMPWLQFVGWVALLGFIAWLVLRPVPVIGASVHRPCAESLPARPLAAKRDRGIDARSVDFRKSCGPPGLSRAAFSGMIRVRHSGFPQVAWRVGRREPPL